MRSRWMLIGLGLGSLGLYLAVTGLSFRFNWGEGYADRPIVTYVALYLGLFALYAAACAWVLRTEDHRRTLKTLLVLGLLFRGALLPAHPIQEDDVYRYLWDGKVVAEGINPFKYAPQEVHEFPFLRIRDPETLAQRYTPDEIRELERLNRLKWENARALRTLDRVNHPHVPTIYPPMAQAVFGLVAHFQPDSILALRLAFLVFDLAAVAFVIGILNALGKKKTLCLIYFWSPLVIKETFNSTHLDIIGIAFLCGCLYFLVQRRRVAATLFLAFSFLSKFYSGILLPLVLQLQARAAGGGRRPAWTGPAVHALLFGAAVGVFYLPFLGTGPRTFEGLRVYSTYWQSNDSLFALGVAFFGEGFGLYGWETEILNNPLPVFLMKAVAGLAVVSVLVGLLLRRPLREDRPEQALNTLFILMAVVFLLSPVQNPWYLCWLVPFLCLFPWKSWILLTGLEGLYYLDFYFDYQGIPQFRSWIPWFEYAPFYLALAWEWRTRRRKRRTGDPSAQALESPAASPR